MLPPHPYYTRNRARQNRRSFDVPFSLLTPIDYESEEAVILAVDSSIIGFGYVLYQEGTVNGRRVRFVSRFGSGNWNERESNYSQPKIELYGLLRALKAVRVHIIGVKNLVVEVDAKYIKGMINNPDIQPNAVKKEKGVVSVLYLLARLRVK